MKITKKTVLNRTFSIEEFAKRRVYRCKEDAYGEGTNATNELADFGRWDELEDLLVDFSTFVLNSYLQDINK